MADIEINKSDIDEVNDVIQETDEEAYALDSEFTEEKEYKTVQKYELVTILSYLIGVRNEILDHMCSDEYVELLNSLRENKNARILRYLCKARTGLLRNYKKTDNEIKYNLGNINRMEWFDAEFDRVIGLEQIAVFHVNDSLNPLGAHKDRHANIGKGTIGYDTLHRLVHDETFANVPKILETPWLCEEGSAKKTIPPYKEEIEWLLK